METAPRWRIQSREMDTPPPSPNPPEFRPMPYARVGESVTPTDPFDRQIVGLFRGFIYLMVLVPCAGAIITVAYLMLRHR